MTHSANQNTQHFQKEKQKKSKRPQSEKSSPKVARKGSPKREPNVVPSSSSNIISAFSQRLESGGGNMEKASAVLPQSSVPKSANKNSAHRNGNGHGVAPSSSGSSSIKIKNSPRANSHAVHQQKKPVQTHLYAASAYHNAPDPKNLPLPVFSSSGSQVSSSVINTSSVLASNQTPLSVPSQVHNSISVFQQQQVHHYHQANGHLSASSLFSSAQMFQGLPSAGIVLNNNSNTSTPLNQHRRSSVSGPIVFPSSIVTKVEVSNTAPTSPDTHNRRRSSDLPASSPTATEKSGAEHLEKISQDLRRLLNIYS